MNKPFRLGVLQMPSSRGAAWRSGLQAASHGKSWAVTKVAGASIEECDPSMDLVILLRDGTQALALAPLLDACVVIVEPLDTVLASMAALYPDKPIKAYAVAAERLAAARTMIDQGAQVVQAAAVEAKFPLIATVTRGELVTAAVDERSTLSTAPLDMYDDYGPQPGHQTTWSWELFNYKTTPRSVLAPPHIDLTGRARVIFHGPRFFLPAGEWRIRLRFHLDPEGRSSALKFEWGAANDFEVLELQLEVAGLYEIELTKRWDAPIAAELRVWAASAHFVGSLEFLDSNVTCLARYI